MLIRKALVAVPVAGMAALALCGAAIAATTDLSSGTPTNTTSGTTDPGTTDPGTTDSGTTDSGTTDTPGTAPAIVCDGLPSVTIFGDSLVARDVDIYQQAFTERGWKPKIFARGGRTTQWGAQQVKRVRDNNHLADIVVIALGTNDTRSALFNDTGMTDRIRKIMQIVGPTRTVYWVGVAFAPESNVGIERASRANLANLAIAEQAAIRPNLVEIPWARKASSLGSTMFSRDGVHLTPDAYPLRADYVADLVTAAQCTPN